MSQPREKQPGGVKRDEQRKTTPRQEINVLHVDDDESYGRLLQRWFERAYEGVSVTVETDPTRALGRLEHGTATDIVVSDYRMPEMTGIEFLERIRQHHPTLPFVMLTGEGSESIASEAIHAGVTDYFRKTETGEGFKLLIERVRSLVLEQRAVVESRRFGTLLEMLDVPVAALKEDGRIVSANRLWNEIVDTWPERNEPSRIQDLVSDTERSLVEDYLQTLRDDEGPEVIAADLAIQTDGGVETYRTQMAVVPGVDGNPDGILGIFEPTTEEKRFKATLGDLVEWATGPYVTVDEDWGMTLVNPAAEQLFGREERSLVGHDLWEVFPAFEDATFHDQLRSVMEQGVPLDVETYYAPSGMHFHVRAYRTSKGAAIYLQDVTERVERERELEHRTDRLREFVSIVTHDLRNPLTVAKGYTEFLAEEGAGDAEAVETLERALERAETVIEQTLDFAEEGEVGDLVAVDLDRTAMEAWEGVVTENATIDIESSLRIRADPDALRRIFENLIHNAIQHGSSARSDGTGQHTANDGASARSDDEERTDTGDPTEGSDDPDQEPLGVSVAVGVLPTVETAVGFYFEDDGPGIPPEDREIVFQTGYSTSDDGIGFGLAIVEQVAAAHGWSVRVVEGTRGGARFEFIGIDPVVNRGLTPGGEPTAIEEREERGR